MKTFELYDVVRAAKDLGSNVPKNAVGAILMCLNDSSYEVEFVDEEGETLEILTVNEADLLSHD